MKTGEKGQVGTRYYRPTTVSKLELLDPICETSNDIGRIPREFDGHRNVGVDDVGVRSLDDIVKVEPTVL